MTYQTIFAKSFSRHDQKRLGCGAFVGCLVVAFSFCAVFKPYLSPLPVLNLQLSLGFGRFKMLSSMEKSSNQRQIDIKSKEVKPICDLSQQRSDVCELNGDIRISINSSTIFLASTQMSILKETSNNSWTIRPYARKGDETAMAGVTKFKIKMEEAHSISQADPRCNRTHNVTGIVFSTGGYLGNLFHDFSDVLIPLYLTAREFDGQVQFLVANKKSWWLIKHGALLQKLSRYEIIDMDKDDGAVHCFSRLIVGLKHHKELDIDPSKSPYSMKQFTHFLRSSYSLKRETAIKLVRDDNNSTMRPRLLIVSRKRTRCFMNEGEIVKMSKRLGFDVTVTEADSNLSRFAQLVNSCDVMMGVHGAGMTNMVFLPENAVLIQVLPLGGMEWLARTYFGEPAKDMNLKYLEYKVSEEESSLIQQYPIDHEVIKNPRAISKQGWGAFRSIYLDKQNLKLDVNKFRATLLEAQQLLQM
ncbi:alpha-1,3-arabinosyltransferase XAT3-like [Cornus florida]|uniref:alpha-1,3-arabinosyltransferase XAT3-like n=1 Tax=Cornus florida TaxID=4283 RepID=UPI0028A0E302|nr:alpha-1,3-arabinosyltransferase XAT3-like [Cornus florida]